MHGNIIINILIAIGLIILGWTLGQVFADVSLFTLDWSISLTDVLAILVEIFLACFIAFLVDKGMQNQRAEKDIFISELNDAQQSFSELEKQCSRIIPLSYPLTVYEIEKNKKCLLRMWGSMSEGAPSFYKQHDAEFKAIINDIKLLNTQLLDSKYFKTIDVCEPIKITKNVIHLNKTVIPTIGKTFETIKERIFKMKISINNM